MANNNDQRHTSAFDSGEGRLEIANATSFIQIESVLSAHSDKIPVDLLKKIREWCDTQKKMNKEANGAYTIAWKKLETVVKDHKGVRDLLLLACEAYNEYTEGVESGSIVPTPTPPPTAVDVSRTQGGIKRQTAAAIYGRNSTPKPPDAENDIPEPSNPPSEKLKVG